MGEICEWTDARRVVNGRHYNGWETSCDNFYDKDDARIVTDRDSGEWDFVHPYCPGCDCKIEVQA